MSQPHPRTSSRGGSIRGRKPSAEWPYLPARRGIEEPSSVTSNLERLPQVQTRSRTRSRRKVCDRVRSLPVRTRSGWVLWGSGSVLLNCSLQCLGARRERPAASRSASSDTDSDRSSQDRSARRAAGAKARRWTTFFARTPPDRPPVPSPAARTIACPHPALIERHAPPPLF